MISPLAPPTQSLPPLLVVEDSDEDFETLQRFLRRSPTQISIQRCIDGDQALAFLYRTGDFIDPGSAPRPGLIVLDLNLPGTDGREVLRQIKQDQVLRKIPLVVFTTSNNPRDIAECYQQGANSYIIKPIDFERLKQDIQTLVAYWFEVTVLPDIPED